MRFAGSVCIVSGGGSGIGRATCRRLAREGGRVLALDIDAAAAAAAAASIAGAGGESAHHRADVADEDHVRAAVDDAVAR